MISTSLDFDLLVEPWIPVVSADGMRQEKSLLDCLRQAHTLREVADPSPIVTFGLYRFLASVLQTYGPISDLDDWANLWDQGVFSEDFLDGVGGGCDGRLRLFDRERPFYQSGDIPLDGKSKEALKTVGYLALEDSTGTNVTHFAHRGDAGHAYCPSCAAKALLTLPAFAISGGAGIKPAINGVPPIYVLPRGDNLFQTLLLNHVAPLFQPALRTKPGGGALWTEQRAVEAKEEKSSVGFIESLTWPARRVRLRPGSGGLCTICGRASPALVRQMVYGQGRSRPKDLPTWDDPWVAYYERKKGDQSERLPVRLQQGRDVWRDFPILFLAQGGAAFGNRERPTRPAVLRQIDQLLTGDLDGAGVRIHFETFGLRTDMKAKVFEWRQDLFDFPSALLGGAATATVEKAVRYAEDTGSALSRALRKLHPVVRRGTTDQVLLKAAMRGLITIQVGRFWSVLELPFRERLGDPRLLDSLAAQNEWNREWSTLVRRTGWQILDNALEPFDASARELRCSEEVRHWFAIAVSKLAGETAAPSAPAPEYDENDEDS